MKKFDFIACSLVFHAALFIIALLLPPPFPSAHTTDKTDYALVELKPMLETGAGEEVTVPEEETQDTGPAKVVRSAVPAPPPASPSPLPHTVRPLNPAALPPSTPPRPATPPKAQQPAQPQPPPSQPAPQQPAPRAPEPAVSVTVAGATGITADKTAINFKYQKGWPVPAMVRLDVGTVGGGGGEVDWRAERGRDWIILSQTSGTAPSVLKVGVDTSKLPLGYHEGSFRVMPVRAGLKGYEVSVSAMVLPKSPGLPELPHSSWDAYMDGNCKACHLPKELMPSLDFMSQPEFCDLCHNPSGMAQDKVLKGKGHPVLVDVNSGGAKKPTLGTIPSGTKSDSMATHLKDGKLVVCVTCHNAMEKPGDYGRTWEMTSTRDQKTYILYKGGWENMGYIEPKVYAATGLMEMPHFLKDVKKYLVDPAYYSYDEAEGTVTFKGTRKKDEMVYVTLDNPYLRVTTENNRLCFDCHYENTHQGLNCLACHKAHGTYNIKCIRPSVRTPDKVARPVVFRAKTGKNSFADGDAPHDGICEVCHPLTSHKDGKTYAGEDCTRCHSHKNGFGI